MLAYPNCSEELHKECKKLVLGKFSVKISSIEVQEDITVEMAKKYAKNGKMNIKTLSYTYSIFLAGVCCNDIYFLSYHLQNSLSRIPDVTTSHFDLSCRI